MLVACVFFARQSSPSDYTQCAQSIAADKLFGYSDNAMSADLDLISLS